MEGFIKLIENEAFIALIATYGLATLIVIFIIFFRDPRRFNVLLNQYKQLENDYKLLAKSYNNLDAIYRDMRKDIEKTYKLEYDQLDARYKALNTTFLNLEKDYQQLEADIHPETRRISVAQARHLTFIGLDRDLYKLYYLMSKKIDFNTDASIENFVRESIRLTNDTWNNFRSPFSKIKHIGSLYEIYSNQGTGLKEKLDKLFNQETDSNDKKKTELWNMLLKNTLDQKQKFDEFSETYKINGDYTIELDEES